MEREQGRPPLDSVLYKVRFREAGSKKVHTWYTSNPEAFDRKLNDEKYEVRFAACYSLKEVYIP